MLRYGHRGYMSTKHTRKEQGDLFCVAVPQLNGLTMVNTNRVSSEPILEDDITVYEKHNQTLTPQNSQWQKRRNEEQVWREIGKVEDAVKDFISDHVRDGGKPLHNNKYRTQKYSPRMRQFTKSSKGKNDGFSIMLQQVCQKSEFHKFLTDHNFDNFQRTKRHVDGPNDHQTGCRHTFILSTFILINDCV